MGGDTGRLGQKNSVQLIVSIAGGDSWVGIPPKETSLDAPPSCFNRRWRFLGGDTAVIAADAWRAVEFQSQVAILGWGYGGGGVASN